MNVNTINLGGTNFPIEDTEARRRITAIGEIMTGDPSALGTDMSAQFAAEINAAPFSGNVWAWIQARIHAGNFDGINVGDFIQFTAGGNVIKAEIAGINTYKNYGDTPVPNHIDFISRDCWPVLKPMNPFNYNNGTTEDSSPWKASDLYFWLNSLQGNVVGSAAADGLPLNPVDYRNNGVWDKLPVILQNVIVQKRLLLPRRYTAGSLLTDDNLWDWKDAGLLWIPSEVEVYGMGVWGSTVLTPTTTQPNGYATGGFQQYPIFANNMRRVKNSADGSGSRSGWWLLSACGGDSTAFCYVHTTGRANTAFATGTGVRAPLCFRIA